MSSEWALDRRSVLRMGLAVVALGAVGNPPGYASTRPSATTTPIPDSSDVAVESVEPAVRYEFICHSAARPIGTFTSLAEVWAFTRYMKIIYGEAEYVGPGEHTLTIEEAAIVQVARDAGMVVDDPADLYRTILATCTRIAPASLDARLSELGVPVVKAALALAPDAPQARQFRSWLDAQGVVG